MDLPKLHLRETDTHKNDYGRVFVVAGSAGMIGAACLTAEAALRGGAGYVRLGLPRSYALNISSNSKMSCILTTELPETDEGALGLMAKDKILAACEGYDVVAIGPGLSTSPQTRELVLHLLRELDLALVVDADALNTIARHPEILPELKRQHGLPILTPHPGEFVRLTGKDQTPREPVIRLQECRDYAAKHDLVCVLKGSGTVVSDGTETYVNESGNPGMATAGSGDVLTGVIAALRGQGYDSLDAAVLGVYLHGLAGDLAAESLGQWGTTARDILEQLPAAFLTCFNNQA